MKKGILLSLGLFVAAAAFADKCPSPERVINDWHSTEDGNWSLSKSSESPRASGFQEVSFRGQEVSCFYTDPNGTQIGLIRHYPGQVSGEWGRGRDCKSQDPNACQFTVVNPKG